eukprot:2381867-Rhodomonas_salina.2
MRVDVQAARRRYLLCSCVHFSRELCSTTRTGSRGWSAPRSQTHCASTSRHSRTQMLACGSEGCSTSTWGQTTSAPNTTPSCTQPHHVDLGAATPSISGLRVAADGGRRGAEIWRVLASQMMDNYEPRRSSGYSVSPATSTLTCWNQTRSTAGKLMLNPPRRIRLSRETEPFSLRQ